MRFLAPCAVRAWERSKDGAAPLWKTILAQERAYQEKTLQQVLAALFDTCEAHISDAQPLVAGIENDRLTYTKLQEAATK